MGHRKRCVPGSGTAAPVTRVVLPATSSPSSSTGGSPRPAVADFIPEYGPRPGPAAPPDPAGVAPHEEADQPAVDDPVGLQVPRLAGQPAAVQEPVYLPVLFRFELVIRRPALAYDVLGGPSDPPSLLVAPGLHARILPPHSRPRRTGTTPGG